MRLTGYTKDTAYSKKYVTEIKSYNEEEMKINVQEMHIKPQLYQDRYPYQLILPLVALVLPSWHHVHLWHYLCHQSWMLNFDTGYCQEPIPNIVEHPYINKNK
jgi:hypothetical protein